MGCIWKQYEIILLSSVDEFRDWKHVQVGSIRKKIRFSCCIHSLLCFFFFFFFFFFRVSIWGSRHGFG